MEMIKATIEDLLVYQSVARETFYDAYVKDTDPSDLEKYMSEHFTDEIVSEELNDPHSIAFFLKNADGNIVGYIKLRWNTTHELLTGRSIELQRIYVLKEFYNKGYGKILIDYAEQYGRQHGFEWIWLCVWGENQGAIRFYERAGWKKFGMTKFKFGDTVYDDPVFKKRL
jgi:ribosomal protein S18 acetylase RimI-like enzyme